MKKLIKYFLEGLLFVIPVIVSIYVVFVVFTKIDSLLHLPIPGIGFITTIVLITLLGFLGSSFFAKSIYGYIDALFNRLPIVKIIYSSVKDLIGAFVGDKKKFDKPVLIKLSKDLDVKVIGFITRDSLENLKLLDQIAVYIPQSYNFAGNLIVVPKENVSLIDADSSEVFKFIVSGGVS